MKLFKLIDPMYGFNKYCKAYSALQAYTYFRYVLGIKWASLSLIKLVPEIKLEPKSTGSRIVHENGYTTVYDEYSGEELDHWEDD